MMNAIVGGLATGAGLLVRFLLWLFPRAAFGFGLGLLIYGISLFDRRVAYITLGLAFIALFYPGPKETK